MRVHQILGYILSEVFQLAFLAFKTLKLSISPRIQTVHLNFLSFFGNKSRDLRDLGDYKIIALGGINMFTLDKAGKLLFELWTVCSGLCAVYISVLSISPSIIGLCCCLLN